MDIQEAVDNFVDALQHCQNLIVVHRAAGNGGRGRRTTETSLNRGTIVLTVATWQAFVQDLANVLRDAALAELHKVTNAPLLTCAMTQWRTDLDAEVAKFATPGPDQTRALLGRVGFDPRPSWTWKQQGGRGSAQVLVEPKHVTRVIEHWLRVRHDVAHGHATITALPILTAVRDPSSSARAKAAPTLRLTDAIDCLRFFRSVVRVTADAAAQHIGQAPPTWTSVPPLALGLHPSAL